MTNGRSQLIWTIIEVIIIAYNFYFTQKTNYTSQIAEREEVCDDIIMLKRSPEACYMALGYIVRFFLASLTDLRTYFQNIWLSFIEQAYVTVSKIFKQKYSRGMYVADVDKMNEALFSVGISRCFFLMLFLC